MTVNYTRPGRLHLIIGGAEAAFYLTLIVFGRRLHVGRASRLDVDGDGWMRGAIVPGKRKKNGRPK